MSERSANPPVAGLDAGLLFEHHPQPMWVQEEGGGRFLAVNGTAVERYGYSREEFLAATTDLIVLPGPSGDGSAGLVRHRLHGGQVVAVEVASRPIRFAGQPAELVLIHEDRTSTLRDSEARLRTIFDSEPECVKVVSRDGRLLDMNPAGLAMIEAEDVKPLVGLAIADLVHVEDRPVFAALHARAVAGTSGHARFRIRGLSGTERWVESHSTPMREPDGSIGSVLSVTRDVTDRVRVELGQRLHAAESRVLEMISVGAPLAEILMELVRAVEAVVPPAIASILLLDADGKTIRHGAAPSLPDLYNQAIDGLEIGPTMGSCGTALHRRQQVIVTDIATDPLWEAYRDLALPLGLRACWSTPIIAGNGEALATFALYYREPRAPAPVEERVIARAVHLVRIAIERTRETEALRNSEERFRQLAENIAEVFWLVDVKGNRFLYVSPAYETIWGASLAALYDDPTLWMALVHPDDLSKVVAAVKRRETGGYNLEYRIVRADGTTRWVADRGFPIRNEQGQVTRIVGVARDVTDRIELEERLRQAQRLEAVGQLTGGVAHDFNNLLTVILGNADLLDDSLSDQPQLQRLAAATRAAAERGADLTNRLLAFSRRQALDPKTIDVAALMAGMDALLRRTLGGHVEIEVTAAKDLWRAFVDAPQLENAILNLCINARDAMPEGGRLGIEMTNVELDRGHPDWNEDVAAGQYVLLSVRDTGTGMAPRVLARAFEPFFTTKEVGKGSGLGLSMVFGFARQSNGHVKIWSQEGQGTVVKLYLPRGVGDVQPAAGIETVPAAAGAKEKILLVEDDDLVRAHVEGQLQSLGYDVVTAASGREALEELRQAGDFDLLFTDVVMPGGMSGRQLAEAARLLQPTLPVLFTSGYSDDAVVHGGRLDAGMHLLSKPYRRHDLARRVEEVLGKVDPNQGRDRHPDASA